MSEAELIDRYIDALNRDPNAAPPSGLDSDTAAFVRTLVLAEKNVPPARGTQERVWYKALALAEDSPPGADRKSSSRGSQQNVTILKSNQNFAPKEDDMYTSDALESAVRLDSRTKPPTLRDTWQYTLMLVAASVILILLGGVLVEMVNQPIGGYPALVSIQTEEPKACIAETVTDMTAESVRLADAAMALLKTRAADRTPEMVEQAGLLALCALQTAYTPEADRALQQVMGIDEVVPTFVGNGDGATFSPDGRYLLTGDNELLRLWNLETGEPVREFVGHTEYISALVFSPDGRYILSGSEDKTARMWDVETGEEIRQFVGHTALIQMRTVAFSPDGRYILTGSDDTTVRLWDAETGEEIRQFAGHRMPVFGAAFSPDGRYVATSSWDTTVRLWDAATGDELRQYARHNSWAAQLAFSSDGKYLLNSGAYVVRLSDVETGETIREYQVQGSRALEFPSFSPDGRYVLASDRDNKLALLWDAESAELVRIFDGRVFDPDAWRMYDVNFSPDGQSIVVAMAGPNNAPHLVWVWDTDYQDTVALACQNVTRDFTAEERALYGLGEGAVCPA